MGATAQRRSDILRQLGLLPTIVPMRKVAEGIEAVRALLPRCWFDAENCAEGLKALRHYRIKESSGLPLHDSSSHFADSMRYQAIGYREGMIWLTIPSPDLYAVCEMAEVSAECVLGSREKLEVGTLTQFKTWTFQ